MMRPSRVTIRRSILAGSFVFILVALAIWTIRPWPFSKWMGEAELANSSPLSVLQGWVDGSAAPLTPIGLLSLFPVADVVILLALLTALSVIVLLLSALWRDSWSGAWLTRPIPALRIPRFRRRVRTVLVAIAIVGLELGWDVVAWRGWPLHQRYLGAVVQQTDAEAPCVERLREIERQLAAIDADSPIGTEGETRTASARAADRAQYRDLLKGQTAYWSALAGAYGRSRRTYERAATDPLRPLPPDPPLPDYPSGPMDWLGRGQYARALAGFEEEIRTHGDYVSAIDRRAWILATCPDTSLRDGKLAVATATRAAELTNWKDEQVLSTLAAAYAESGDFAAAVRWQQRALERHAATGVSTKADQDRLALYKAGKPYRAIR